MTSEMCTLNNIEGKSTSEMNLHELITAPTVPVVEGKSLDLLGSNIASARIGCPQLSHSPHAPVSLSVKWLTLQDSQSRYKSN